MKRFYLPLIIMMSFALVLSACKKDEEEDDDTGLPPGSYAISGYSQDAVTFNNMTNAMITVTDISGAKIAEAMTDATGKYAVVVAAGTYNLSVTKDGYQTQTAKNVVVGNVNLPDVFVGFMPVDNSITTPVGALCGKVLNSSGAPLANATVSISAEDESLTNGYFASVKSDALGEFAIGAIPLEKAKNEITAFKIKVVQGNFIDVIHNIEILQNQLVVKNVDLVNQNVPGNTIFSEGFETESAWTYDGFFHRQTNAIIQNSNFVSQYVQLAPNDNSNGYIPDAYDGKFCAWYGQESTGSFIGEPLVGQEIGSGGTSTAPYYMGHMMSPEIDLTNLSQASLSFWTWFEIESVNPNESGFDIMEIHVHEVGGMEESIGRLNPYSDPILEDRDALPFTSGGFNKVPVWVNVEYDLTAYVGKTIKLKFEFRTVDELYNGFRGWFVDNVLVTDKAPVKAANANKVFGPDPKPRTN